jgi:dolichol-phosphate hexosyltransferase
MRLLIAIPALNEEASIGTIIQRTLDASQFIVANSPVTQVEITVVSDGSTDRTVEIARAYGDRIRLIVFECNRGYGAAIKEAWRDSKAELLGFLDADGTCDPRFFADLCRGLETQHADIALGCRLSKDTQMPRVRQAGNQVFALLLTLSSGLRVRDTASGMRVVRRDSYRKLLPLPDGLHFTPAMSARAVLGPRGDIKLIELDMPYHERDGVSKLHVVRDGLRFLRIIFEALFLYRPFRPLFCVGAASLVLAVSVMASPVMYYLAHRSVQEWMIYRFIIGHLAATNAFLMFSLAILTRLIVRIAVTGQYGPPSFTPLENAFLSPFFWLYPSLLLVCGTLLIVPERVGSNTAGFTNEHWSRFIAMSFFYLVAAILISARVAAYFLKLIADQVAYSHAERTFGAVLPGG